MEKPTFATNDSSGSVMRSSTPEESALVSPTNSTDERFESEAPPGPRGPGLALGLAWLAAEPRMFRRWRDRYGDVFMLHSTGFAPPLVVVSSPAEAKRIFSADPASVRAGDANGGPLREML